MNGNASLQRSNETMDLWHNLEAAVLERYGNAAQEVEACLCLPVSYDKDLLKVIPDEIIEKDYGCGDPSRYIRSGETVLDLGSGSGKACYIICANRRRHRAKSLASISIRRCWSWRASIKNRSATNLVITMSNFAAAEFKTCRPILIWSIDYLQDNPVRSVADLAKLEEFEIKVRREQPLIADESIDVIVSNCVLNLVRPEDKKQLFAEMYRVLKRGGRIAISDIVSDEAVPEHLAKDPNLWSACVSGAFQEEDFFRAFEDAKFHGIQIEDLRMRSLIRPSKASSFAPSP